MINRRRFLATLALTAVVTTACGSGAAPTATPVPPTATTAPPSPTPVPPTATPVPPTATVVPATQRPAAAATKPAAAAAGTKPAAKPAGGNLLPEVEKSLAAFAAVKSFQMEGTISAGTAGSEQQMKIEHVRPDRYHMTMTATGIGTTEMILIGSTMWMKPTGQTAWVKIEGATAQQVMASMADSTDVDKMTKSMAAYTFAPAGADAVNGEPCLVFSYQGQDVIDGKFWVSTRDFLPRRIESTTTKGKTSIVLSRFNEAIVIEEPAA